MKPYQLIRSTPSGVRNSARSVQIIEATRARLKSSKRLRVKAVVSSRSRRGVKHKVVVEATTSSAESLHNTDVRVWCNCEFFKYYGCSDVLPIYNAGFSKKATGFMPDIKNPKRVPFVCLHVIRVLNKIIRDKK